MTVRSPRAPTTAEAVAAALDVVALDDPRALDASSSGAKAANLARAAARRLPVLPGFVVTTVATDGGTLAPRAIALVERAWRAISGDEGATLVVRSSSTVEDTNSSSMAGQFTSVLGVRGWDGLLDAIATVLASAARRGVDEGPARPMAVLVQPQLDAGCGGVLFGLDPSTATVGTSSFEAVAGTPDALVGGTATAVHCLLGRRGRLVAGSGSRSAPCSRRIAGGGWPISPAGPAASSMVRRTWNGRSTTPDGSGYCRAVR